VAFTTIIVEFSFWYRQVRLYGRPRNDLTDRFPLIVEALARLRSRSCIIDGEAIACDENGIASFDRIRHHRHDERVFLYAFDLLELNGDDLHRDPLQVRKATLYGCGPKGPSSLGTERLRWPRRGLVGSSEVAREYYAPFST
jgi:ATP dependent DNA ligase domain